MKRSAAERNTADGGGCIALLRQGFVGHPLSQWSLVWLTMLGCRRMAVPSDVSAIAFGDGGSPTGEGWQNPPTTFTELREIQ